MASPLGLLNLRALPKKSLQLLSELPIQPINPTRNQLTKRSDDPPMSIQLEAVKCLAPLTAITLPFFLDPQDLQTGKTTIKDDVWMGFISGPPLHHQSTPFTRNLRRRGTISLGIPHIQSSNSFSNKFLWAQINSSNHTDALAVGGEFGLLEGRTAALIHPIVLGSFFFYTLYAGYLGWQWRRVRTIQNEISELKKQVKPVPATAEGTPPAATSVSPIEAKIQQLSEERKELVKGSFRDRHFNAGSILLGFGVFEAVGGPVNTWMRTGKLFPGPHLFAGAAITVLWAAAAALVPAMQKGNETARNLHIALNVLNVLLFASQIPTGLDIVWKVFEFTQWP